MTKRAAIYIRQSQTSDDTISPELQEQHCREMCQRENFQITEVYSDIDISGRSTVNRPGLLRLVKDHKAGKFDIAIADDYSRFARNMTDGAQIIGSIPVGTYSEGIPEDADDDFAPLLYMLLAHKFSKDMSKRWKATHAHRMAKGLPPNGAVPYGYKLVDGKPVIDPETGPIVRDIFKRFTSGVGANTISNQFYASGNSDRKWSTTSVYRILDNPFYVGTIKWGEVEIPGSHEPLLKEEEWEAYLRERGKRQQKGRAKPRKSSWPYAGIVVCSHCGSVMVNNAKRDVLTCSGYANKGKDFCPGVWRRTSRTIYAINIWVAQHNEEMTKLIPSTDADRKKLQELADEAKRELEKTDREITQLQLLAIRQNWSDDQISGAMVELNADRENASQKLSNALADLGSIPEPDDTVWGKLNAMGGTFEEDGTPTFTEEGMEQVRAYVSKYLKEVRVLPRSRKHNYTDLYDGYEFIKV